MTKNLRIRILDNIKLDKNGLLYSETDYFS